MSIHPGCRTITRHPRPRKTAALGAWAPRSAQGPRRVRLLPCSSIEPPRSRHGSSRSVPIEFLSAPRFLPPRNSVSSCVSPSARPSARHGPELDGEWMGSGWGLIGDSDPSGSTPRTEEVSAIHWFAASRSPKGDGSLATGDRLELPSGGSAAPRPTISGREPDERADGPEPGHLIEEARSEETEGRRALRRRAGRDRSTTWTPWTTAKGC